jgi:hypothetical protein
MRSFENIDKDNAEKLQKNDAHELGFQHMADTEIVNGAKKKKERRRKERG